MSLRPEDPSSAATKLEPIKLSDYRPPDWRVESVELTFDLRPSNTRVTAAIAFELNPERVADPDEAGLPPLQLDGRKLTRISAAIDGRAIDPAHIDESADGLTIAAAALPGRRFLWTCETEIDPKSNTALEGLYMSRDMFCTQCEAQGFRKITYYPDRPDVMTRFTVRIEADKTAYPVLLSNGNPVDRGHLPEGRHFAVWRDPHPKPAYLFALVAGDLAATNDSFVTRSGRRVDLALFTRPGDEGKTAFALDSLKRAMKWDEQVYGLEYDLDLFMIVAVDDFNMGAMENKGLNIFNSKYVLASPETATDRDYELIESVVAHEYFHNWTGNRVTCRDWFQLCLKEGLTVFRDQQFSEDERSAAEMRIDSVKMLRARQFREDAGPLAHPVRPTEYVEINNFYTATVYEKGAEVIRMLRTLLGAETYRKAIDLYFERHDGQACTIEQFRQCFEDASGRDLSRFALWWSQAGTPRLKVEERYDAEKKAYRLTFRQSTPATPGQPDKEPLVIPIAFGLLDRSGRAVPLPAGEAEAPESTHIAILDAPARALEIEGLPEKPVLSINRGFAAPVIVERTVSTEDRMLLLAHDPDPFNRWEAARDLAMAECLRAAAAIEDGQTPDDAAEFVSAMGSTVSDETLDPALRALALSLPSEDEMANEISTHGVDGAARPADPDALHAGREHIRRRLGEGLQTTLGFLYDAMSTPGAYSPDAASAGKRALKNAALGYLTALRTPEAYSRAAEQFRDADNMTEQMPALTLLVHLDAPQAEAALEAFYDRWKRDALVLGKWFGIQAMSPLPAALDHVAKLTEHPAFEWTNPNKFRALIGAFGMANPVNFHRKDGAGYRFYVDWVARLDPVNPQTAAKLVGAFETKKRYDDARQALMQAELERLAATEGLSKDAGEMVKRLLDA